LLSGWRLHFGPVPLSLVQHHCSRLMKPKGGWGEEVISFSTVHVPAQQQVRHRFRRQLALLLCQSLSLLVPVASVVHSLEITHAFAQHRRMLQRTQPLSDFLQCRQGAIKKEMCHRVCHCRIMVEY
jgi:hypothetical protein